MGMFGSTTRSSASVVPPMSDRDKFLTYAADMLIPGLGRNIRVGRNQRVLGQMQNQFMSDLDQRLQGTPDSIEQAQIANNDGQDISAAFAPQYDLKPGQAPLDINSPELPTLALRAQRLGIPLNQVMDALKAQQPDVKIGPDGRPYNAKSMRGIPQRFANPQAVNNTITDLNDPSNINRVIPSEPVKGAMPVYDNLGHVVDWTLPKGAAATIANAAGSEARGKAQGSAPYDFISVPGPDGKPRVVAKSAAVGGVFEGQAPDDAVYNAEQAKTAAATYKSIQDAGQRAAGSVTRYQRIGALLDGLNTGRLAPTGLEIAKTAASLGYKINPKYGNLEAADALSNAIVLDVMGGSLGAGFSNADRDFAKSMSPTMTQTPQGRKLVIEYGIAKARREQDIAAKARAWQQRFGRIDAADGTGKTFQDYLEAWGEAHPMFTQPGR